MQWVIYMQWNLYKADTIYWKNIVRFLEMSLWIL